MRDRLDTKVPGRQWQGPAFLVPIVVMAFCAVAWLVYAAGIVHGFSNLVTFYLAIITVLAAWGLGLAFYRGRPAYRYNLVYMVLAILLFFIRAISVKTHYDILKGVYEGIDLAPNQYRVLVPFLSAGLHGIVPGLSWVQASRVWNLLFVLAFPPLFHVYLRRWFDDRVSFTLTFLSALLLPLTFLYAYPADFLELDVFILGFMLIMDDRWVALTALIFIETLVRETSAFLVVSYAVTYFMVKKTSDLAWRVTALTTAWAIPFAVLRVIYGIRPYRCQKFMLLRNFNYVKHAIAMQDAYLFDLLMFVGMPFVVLGILGKYKALDRFLRRNLLTFGLFFVVASSMALVGEVRIFYPMLPLLVPLAFQPLLGQKRQSTPTQNP